MTKVSKGKHRGKKQEKEDSQSAVEPEGEPPAGKHNYPSCMSPHRDYVDP